MARKVTFLGALEAFFTAIGEAICSPGRYLKSVGRFLFKNANLVLIIPVMIVAIVLAVRNMAVLPEQVSVIGFELGQLKTMSMKEIIIHGYIAREAAVLGPLAVTTVCSLLTFISRRSIFPWLISVLSLAIPVFLQISQAFPA